jgi:uncharacterized membrane protein YkoI
MTRSKDHRRSASVAAWASAPHRRRHRAGPLGDQDDGSEKPINGPALDQASAAALAHTGQGSVSDTEVGDEESYYEVEVTLDNGSQTDVQLDRDFNVVGSETDKGGKDEKGGQ